MHPALISWLEDLKSYEHSPHGEFWKVKKENEKVVITFTPDKEKPPVFAASITAVTNPLKGEQSSFTLHCWTEEFNWMHAFTVANINQGSSELDKFIKLLIVGRHWFADVNKSLANVPLEIKDRSIYWLTNNEESMGLTSLSTVTYNNGLSRFRKNQRSDISRNSHFYPISYAHEPNQDEVLQAIDKIYKDRYSNEKKLSRAEGNEKTTQITKEWQEAMIAKNSKRYFSEYPVDTTQRARQLIDLVDMEGEVAYELKVSGNNVHHEFYKDVFKILFANSKQQRFKKFIFITSKVLPTLADFTKSVSKEFDLEVEVFLLKS
jgi:hypothetical protein